MHNPLPTSILFIVALGLGLIAMVEIGFRLRRRRPDPEGEGAGTGAVEGAAFALLGLLIAFTFSGAANRFDERRNLVIEEANDIGTAYLRLDLLAPEATAVLQGRFRAYLDARLAAYRAIPDFERVQAALDRSAALQDTIWNEAIAASRVAGATPQAAMLLLPSLNTMFDIASTRTAMSLMHPPPAIFVLLSVAALLCALLAGYSMGRSPARSWIHILTFAIMTSVATYIIVDLEYPRLGLIRVDAFDQVLASVRESMGS